jgi:hypothetical protein
VHKELKNGAELYLVYVHWRSGEVWRLWIGFSDEAKSDSLLGELHRGICTVSSEGRAWLGRALLAGLRWQGLGWPRARHAWGKRRWFRALVRSSVCGGVRSTPEGAWARACSGALRARRTRGSVLLPVFNSSPRSLACESWQKSGAGLFLAPRAISYV